MGTDRLDILGVPLDRVDRQEALSKLYHATQSTGNRLFTVTTLNPEYVMAARTMPVLREAVERSDLIVCDGVGTQVGARVLHGQQACGISRLTGFEVTVLLAKWSAFGDSGGLFLLGGRDSRAAAKELVSLAPEARIAGAWSGGSPAASMDAESIRRIRESGASVVLVAYGAPEQVLWIERNRQRLVDAGAKTAMGVGGVLDYLSGNAVLAPSLVRRAGLEWLYRLVREPWRIRRQSVLPVFALLVARDALRVRLGAASHDDNRKHEPPEA